MKTLFLAAAATVALAAPAQAVTVFTENFDDYPANAVPWNGSGFWSTGNSVDLVSSGSFSLTCLGGTGNCVDLSGNSPGSLSRTIMLGAGTYNLAFSYTGNQLEGVNITNAPLAGFTVSIGSLNSTISELSNVGANFQTFSDRFTTSGPATLTFTQNGGDNFRGSIIDGISIDAVPEPATWAMMIMGFGLIGWTMRRAKPRVTLGYA